MDKVYTEDEVKKLIKMSHIIASESDFKESEFSEIIKRNRYLYQIGEKISDTVIDYDKYYLRWSPEYLVWYKTEFKSFPHNDSQFSENHLDKLLALRDRKLNSVGKLLDVATFDEYKVHQLKLQRISEEIEKQKIKVEL